MPSDGPPVPGQAPPNELGDPNAQAPFDPTAPGDPAAPGEIPDPNDPFAQNTTVIPQTTKPRQMPSGGGGGIDPMTGQPMLDDPLADPSLDPMAEPSVTDDPAGPVEPSLSGGGGFGGGAETNPTNNFPPKTSRLIAYIRRTNPELSDIEVRLLAEAAGKNVDHSNIIPPGMSPRVETGWTNLINRGIDRAQQAVQKMKAEDDLRRGIRPGQGAHEQGAHGQEKPGYFENGRFKHWTVQDQVNNSPRSDSHQPTVDEPYNQWGPPKGPRVRPQGDDIIDAEIVPDKTYAPKTEPPALAPDRRMLEPRGEHSEDEFLDPKPRHVPPYLGDVTPQDLSHPDVEAPEQTNGGHPDAPKPHHKPSTDETN